MMMELCADIFVQITFFPSETTSRGSESKKKFNEYKCMWRSEMQTAGDMANVIKHQIENNIRLHGAAVNTENFNLIW